MSEAQAPALGRARFLLFLGALAFAGFGVAFLVRPAAMIAATDIAADTAGGRVEIRAMYGGLELALAVYLFWCTRRPERYRGGLLLALLAFAGLGGTRLLALAAEGIAPPFSIGLVATELVGALLAFWGWRSTRPA